MKLLKTQLFIYIHWIVFFIPFSIWMYIEFFVGTANTNIDDICRPISIILLATIAVRVVICSIYEEIKEKEPRFLLDKDSQCYGCQFYRRKEDCIQDHIDDDFDCNNGACDVDCICAGGSMSNYNI